MHEFLSTKFRHNPGMDPHITLYLFKHRDPWFEVSDLKKRVEVQAKNINQTERTCKELWDIVDFMTEKANRLSKNRIKKREKGGCRGP